ncbi:MAG: hypothetical protein SGJ01_12885 [Gemmatimonadota bacterium]|nr:hypothetical protein [Gemmatimonadota bacterium]
MSESPILTEARELIRAGSYHPAIEQLMAGIAQLPVESHRKAYNLAGLAFYFNQEWAEALGMFQAAAKGSEVPEDWFSIAMCQVKLGDTTGGLETWQKVFDLSYAHPGAPETGTFFQKKLLFAQALRDAGACHPVGLDLLEHQLMGFFTNSHSTDPHTWGIRGVPQVDEVMETTRDYYRLMGKPLEAWAALCDRVAAAVDDEGREYCAGVRGSLGE